MADGTNENGERQSNWTVDVQRGLAWTIVLVFAFVILATQARVILSADIGDVNDVLKSALAVLFNIVMLVLGYFFGSSKGSKDKDDTQNRIVEKMTAPSAPGGVAPEVVAAAATAAAIVAAPKAAADAAPPAAEVAAPPAAEAAVDAALDERGIKKSETTTKGD